MIAIAYTCAILAGRNFRQLELQKYVSRLKELQRCLLYETLRERRATPTQHRDSVFWIGWYGQLWVGAMEFWADLAHDLMRLKPSKLPYYQKGLRAMTLIQSAL